MKCKTFTLDITFEWFDIEPSYFTCDQTLMMVPKSRSSVKVSIKIIAFYKFKAISLGQGQFSSSYSCKMQTLTLDITFEWYDIEPSYFTCGFLVIRP